MSSMHFYGWKNGLKTGMYYLRSKPAVNAIKFTVDVETVNKVQAEGDSIKKRQVTGDVKVCKWKPKAKKDDEDCLMCSG